MQPLPHRLERRVYIEAPRELVFKFFTDSKRWATWWGEGSSIEPKVGGRVLIRYPGGTEATGSVVELIPPERIVFTYGYVTGQPIPPGTSLVTITLGDDRGNTQLQLTHEFAEAGVRDQHEQGWRYQLSLFSNVVLDELHSRAVTAVDSWFELWSEADDDRRNIALTRIAAPDIHFRDRYSNVSGTAELLAHINAGRRFMPGISLRRTDDVRHCQGMVLANWTTRGSDNQAGPTGTNVFVFGSDGRIKSVTGFANSTR
jgi:uncharacterized protein YndB with AHSA1/START domain